MKRALPGLGRACLGVHARIARSAAWRHEQQSGGVLSQHARGAWPRSDMQPPFMPVAVTVRQYSFFQDFVDKIKKGVAKNEELNKTLDELKAKQREVQESESFKAAQQAKDEALKRAKAASDAAKEEYEKVTEKIKESVEEKMDTESARKIMDQQRTVLSAMSRPLKAVSEHPMSQKIGTVFSRLAEELSKDGTVKYQTPKVGVRPQKPPAADQPGASTSEPKAEPAQPAEKPAEPTARQSEAAAGGEAAGQPQYQYKPTSTTAVAVYKRQRSYFESQWERLRESADSSPFFKSTLNLAEKLGTGVGGAFESFGDRVFGETETAVAIREIKERDPEFHVPSFLRYMKDDVIPIVLNAYFNGDLKTLKAYCADETYRVMFMGIQERQQEGVVYDSRIIDLRDVELMAAKLMEPVPVLIVTFVCQQINCIRDLQGKIVEGAEDDIQDVYYAWAVARDTSVSDMVFKVLEMHVRFAQATV